MGTWQLRFVKWFRDLGFMGKPGVEKKAARDSAEFGKNPPRTGLAWLRIESGDRGGRREDDGWADGSEQDPDEDMAGSVCEMVMGFGVYGQAGGGDEGGAGFGGVWEEPAADGAQADSGLKAETELDGEARG